MSTGDENSKNLPQRVNKSLSLAKKTIDYSKQIMLESSSINMPQLIPYRKNNKWYVFDRIKGELIFDAFDHVDFVDGFSILSKSCIVEKRNKYSIVTNAEDIPVNIWYDFIKAVILNDQTFFIVSNNNKYGLINYCHNIIVQLIYDDISNLKNVFRDWRLNNDSILKVKLNNKWGLIKTENFKERLPCIYDDIEMFGDEKYESGLKVKLSNKWGLIETENFKERLPCIYDDINKIIEYGVNLNGNWEYLDANLKSKETPIIDYHVNVKEKQKNVKINDKNIINMKDIMKPVRHNDKWGYKDSDGKLIIPCIYSFPGDFENGYALVKKDNNHYLINEEGVETPIITDCKWLKRTGDIIWGTIKIPENEVDIHVFQKNVHICVINNIFEELDYDLTFKEGQYLDLEIYVDFLDLYVIYRHNLKGEFIYSEKRSVDKNTILEESYIHKKLKSNYKNASYVQIQDTLWDFENGTLFYNGEIKYDKYFYNIDGFYNGIGLIHFYDQEESKECYFDINGNLYLKESTKNDKYPY